MHNYHTEDFYFHGNGDPIPGPILIRRCADDREAAFRTTSEEIITFCAAVSMGALGDGWVMFRTTGFRLDESSQRVTLQALEPQVQDADQIVVPLDDLRSFIRQVVQRHLVYVMEDFFENERADQMSLMGLIYAASLRPQK